MRSPASPPDRVPRTPVSAGARSPVSKPSDAKFVTMSDSKAANSSSTAPVQVTRDPRLLNRINTSNDPAARNVTNTPGGDSPSVPLADMIDRTVSQSHNRERSYANERSAQMFSPVHQSLSPSTSNTGVSPQVDPASAFVTMLGTLFENSSGTAALRYEQNKIKAKAAHQASLDKKMGDLSKAFPAYAETSSKAKQDTEKDLAAIDQKLAELRKSQADLLAAMPDIFQASRTNTTKRDQEQKELIQRCISIQEELKSNVSDLKQGFVGHKSATSKLEDNYQSMNGQVGSLTGQLRDLSSQLQSSQARCSILEKKHHETQNQFKSLNGDVNTSLSTMKNNSKQRTEQIQQQKIAIDSTKEQAGKILQRLDLLESQHHNFIESQSLNVKTTEELQKTLDVHSDEMKQAASSSKEVSDTVHLVKQEILTVRQSLADAQSKEPSTVANAKDISTLKADVVALKSQLEELEKAKNELKNHASLEPQLFHGDDAIRKSQIEQADIEERLKNCLEEIEKIHERLDEKQVEEDKRDNVIAAQVDEIRVSTQQAQGELGQRIGKLEYDIQKQKVEDVGKMQKLEDSVSQLRKTGNQPPINRLSPPSAPPTPQMNPGPQLPGTSNSPLPPTVPVVSAEIIERLAKAENFFSAVNQHMQALRMAYQQLDNRYNSLTTQPVVRAMVQEMQKMYPYASEAQQEIFDLKQLIEPLKNVPLQLEALKGLVERHKDDFSKVPGLERRIDTLEKERTRNEAKQEKLVEHVKEERGKLVDEIQSQSKIVENLAKDIDRLDTYQKGEPDRLEYLAENLAKKLQAESAKATESLERRLDALEDNTHTGLLGAFTGKNTASKITDHVRDLQNVDTDDDASLPVVITTNETNGLTPSLSGISKTISKPKTLSKSRKRKRGGSLENNDRSDDEDWNPPTRSSPSRRRLRG